MRTKLIILIICSILFFAVTINAHVLSSDSAETVPLKSGKIQDKIKSTLASRSERKKNYKNNKIYHGIFKNEDWDFLSLSKHVTLKDMDWKPLGKHYYTPTKEELNYSNVGWWKWLHNFLDFNHGKHKTYGKYQNNYWYGLMEKSMGMDEARAYGVVDLDFTEMMISHHWSAIFMAETYIKLGNDEQMISFCKAILNEQLDDVALMKIFMYQMGVFDAVDPSLPPTFPVPEYGCWQDLDVSKAQWWIDDWKDVDNNATAWLACTGDLQWTNWNAVPWETPAAIAALTGKKNLFYDIMVWMMKDAQDVHSYKSLELDFLSLMVVHHWYAVYMAVEGLKLGQAPVIQALQHRIIKGQLEQIGWMKEYMYQFNVDYEDPSVPPHYELVKAMWVDKGANFGMSHMGDMDH